MTLPFLSDAGHRGARGFMPSLALVLAVHASSPLSAAPGEVPAPFAAEHFDCADAFDLIAMMVVFRCAAYEAPAALREKIDAAVTRLRELELAAPGEPGGAQIEFCPLANGTGMVPAPGHIYLDDGLAEMSTDGLAEIIAHELEHVRQFERLGARGFKCEYVRAMTACGGCQDRRHWLEAEAYARQDAARDRLLREVGVLP